MNKFFQALLSGIFITFFLDFFIFLGIKENYIDFYNIKLYYNILFADNQNIFVFGFFTLFFGYIITYLNITKISLTSIAIASVISFSALIPSVGYKIGEMMLMQKDVILKDKKYIYKGDIYYNGRKYITFFDKELNKIIKLDKEKLR